MDKKVAFSLAVVCGSIFVFSTSNVQSLALIVFPVACTQSSRNAVLTICLFYLIVSSPVVAVTYYYTGSIILSFIPFVALFVINAAVVSSAILQRLLPVYVALPLALAIVSVPPLAYMNPITMLPLAGWLFPGFGLFGIVLLLVMIGLSCGSKRFGLIGYTGLFAVALPLGSSYAIPTSNSNPGSTKDPVSAIMLQRPYDSELKVEIMRIAYRHEELDLINNLNTEIAVLPESVFGVWHVSDGVILGSSDAAVYGGARVYVSEHQYKNTVVNAKTGEVVYEQSNPPRLILNRSALPVAGRGELFETGVSFLICYELTNSWLVYNAFRYQDTPVVWISNLSWMKSSYLKDRMASLHVAWSRLYSQPLHAAMMIHD